MASLHLTSTPSETRGKGRAEREDLARGGGLGLPDGGEQGGRVAGGVVGAASLAR